MFESLRSLSDSQLITGTKVARAQEHSGLLAMIGFIAETDRRQLFLRRGYSSLYEYCVRELGYSESQAMRRITAARCVVKFPDVLEDLKANEISLATIARVAKILTPQNCSDVLNSIRRKSIREVEAIVAEHEPIATFPPDRVRTIVAKLPTVHTHPMGEIYLRDEGKKAPTLERSIMNEKREDSPSAAIEKLEQPSTEEPFAAGPAAAPVGLGPENPPTQNHSPSPVASTKLERRMRIEFTARQELVEKLERIRAIASHRIPARASMEQIITFMADYVIKREDPVKRHERRQARQLKAKRTSDDSSRSD